MAQGFFVELLTVLFCSYILMCLLVTFYFLSLSLSRPCSVYACVSSVTYLCICVLKPVFSPDSLSVCPFLFPHVSPGFSVLFLCSWSSLHLVFNMHSLPVSLCNPGLYFFYVFTQVTPVLLPASFVKLLPFFSLTFGFMDCSSLLVFPPSLPPLCLLLGPNLSLPNLNILYFFFQFCQFNFFPKKNQTKPRNFQIFEARFLAGQNKKQCVKVRLTMLALRPLPSLLSFHHLLCAVNIPNPWIQDHWFVQALPENPHQIS